MSVNANLDCIGGNDPCVSTTRKCEFAKLKYEQLLSEKYFIETCFSKKFSSYSSKQNLIDMLFEIGSEEPSLCPPATTIDCVTVCDTTTLP